MTSSLARQSTAVVPAPPHTPIRPPEPKADHQRLSSSALLHATIQVTKEIATQCVAGTALAAVCVVFYGWGNPFTNSSDPHALAKFVMWTISVGSVVGWISNACLIAFLLQGRALRSSSNTHTTETSSLLSVWTSIGLALRLSWLAPLVGSAVAAATMLVLFSFDGLFLVKYNIHSFVMCLTVTMLSLRISTSVARFRRQRTVDLTTKSSASLHSSDGLHSYLVIAQQGPKTWTTEIVRYIRVCLPSGISAIATVLYITIARGIQLDTTYSLVRFTIGSACLKILMPLLAKLFIAKQKVRNANNTFLMVAAPILHVEIQQRMAMMKARNGTSLFASCVLVNALEIATRVVSVSIDLASVAVAQRRLERDKSQVQMTQQTLSKQTGKDEEKNRLASLEANFEKWKHHHLRTCAAEILAEMAAEYCGIGLVSMYMVILHSNMTFEKPASTAMTMSELLASHFSSWATQVALELSTDVVGIAIELRLGIPLVETLADDRVKFMRWVVAIMVVQASGICIASLLVDHTV